MERPNDFRVCPLMILAECISPSHEEGATECMEESCAWFDLLNCRCAFVSISWRLGDLRKAVEKGGRKP